MSLHLYINTFGFKSNKEPPQPVSWSSCFTLFTKFKCDIWSFLSGRQKRDSSQEAQIQYTEERVYSLLSVGASTPCRGPLETLQRPHIGPLETLQRPSRNPAEAPQRPSRNPQRGPLENLQKPSRRTCRGPSETLQKPRRGPLETLQRPHRPHLSVFSPQSSTTTMVQTKQEVPGVWGGRLLWKQGADGRAPCAVFLCQCDKSPRLMYVMYNDELPRLRPLMALNAPSF